MLHLFRNIRGFAFDMDGVLTDGKLWLISETEMARCMSVRDGYAMQLALKHGYHMCVVSGGKSATAQLRLEKLGLKHIYMGVTNKTQVFAQWLEETGLKAADVLYMGDDVPDIDVMKQAGLACAPADACAEILELSQYVSPMRGGEGCVRDVVEKVMRLQETWYPEAGIQSV